MAEASAKHTEQVNVITALEEAKVYLQMRVRKHTNDAKGFELQLLDNSKEDSLRRARACKTAARLISDLITSARKDPP